MSGDYYCKAHKQSFKDEKAYHNHMASSCHSIDPEPINSYGRWELRKNSKVYKSFGFYICGCSKTWYSAHAFREFRQTCKSCDKENFPKYLWKNDKNKSSQHDKRDALQKPHLKDLCEACRKGKCLENIH